MTADPSPPAALPPAAVPPAGAGPLAGVRILDIATVLAAPFAATLCADWGAEVVKLELPDGSDPMRGLAPVEDGIALYWKVVNRGKKGIALDLRKPAGRELLLRLLPRFDVLIENFRPGTLDRWGLDIATLRAARPGLVVLRLTGFGQDGPKADRPGFARVFEAMGGLTALCGTADGEPLHMNFPIGDTVAGLFGAFAVAAAVAEARGQALRGLAPTGAEIDLSATEAVLRMLDPLAVEHERLGLVRRGRGNRATYTAPSSMYRTRDGRHLTIVASSDAIFARLCAAIGQPALARDARYATMGARVVRGEELDALLAGWFAGHDAAEAEAALEREQVAFSRVQAIDDIVADAHLRARAAIVRLPDPDLGEVPAPCVVPRLVGRPLPVPRTGPAVGEHNAEVYGAIGLDAEALADLRARQVI